MRQSPAGAPGGLPGPGGRAQRSRRRGDSRRGRSNRDARTAPQATPAARPAARLSGATRLRPGRARLACSDRAAAGEALPSPCRRPGLVSERRSGLQSCGYSVARSTDDRRESAENRASGTAGRFEGSRYCRTLAPRGGQQVNVGAGRVATVRAGRTVESLDRRVTQPRQVERLGRNVIGSVQGRDDRRVGDTGSDCCAHRWIGRTRC